MTDQEDSSPSNHQIIEKQLQHLDLNTSTTEELQLARVYTRKRQQISFTDYNSDNDNSDTDSDDGQLHTERHYHENGRSRHFRTYQLCFNASGLPYQRIIEEKHFDIDGVCRLDVHFGLGQPYLSRKHYWPNQRLKSEAAFWVGDESTMACHKTGHWRCYYESGNIQTEMQYRDGIRTGFCKRYADDGTVEWVKDYTKAYMQRIEDFHHRKGSISFSIRDACDVLGFGDVPSSMKEVNSQYRGKCAPFHPDKTPDPEATDKFIALSRARDVLQEYFENNGTSSNGSNDANGTHG